MPWVQMGGLEIASGRLTGLGTATAAQGGRLPFDGTRLRFRVRFSDSGQKASVRFNGEQSEAVGVLLAVDASGRLSLTEGDSFVSEAEVAPLDSGADYFIEAQFVRKGAAITLSRTNYGTEKAAVGITTLSAEELTANASGTVIVVQLEGSGGLAPAVDELVLGRCGIEPPSYEPLFVDTFERADSALLGSADLPANASWTPSSGSARIVSGALELKELARAAAPLKTVPEVGLRLRATVRGSGGPLWADVNYNSTKEPAGSALEEPGFWVWGSEKATFTNVFRTGSPETEHLGKAMKSGTDYFVELNRHNGAAVLTVRTGSFEGPIFVMSTGSGLTSAQNTGQFLRLGTETGISSKMTIFDDIRVDTYSEY